MRIYTMLILLLAISFINGAKLIDEKTIFNEIKIDTNLISYSQDNGYLKCENQNKKIKIYKFNKDGKKEWVNTIDDNISYEAKYIKSFDDFFLIVGKIDENSEIFIINGDNKKRIFWKKRYKVKKLKNRFSIERSSDGFLIANLTQKSKLWLMKIDLEGNKIWEKIINKRFLNKKIFLSIYQDNYFLALNYSYLKRYNIKLFNLDANGTILWEKSISKKRKSIEISSLLATKNYLYLADYSLSKILEARIYKFDYSGKKIWEEKFLQHKINKMRADNSDIIISGRVNDIKLFTKYLFVAKINSDGVKLWENRDRYYKLDFPLEIKKSDNNLVIFGISDYSTIDILNLNENKIIRDNIKFRIIDVIAENNATNLEKFLESYLFDLNSIEYKREKLLYYGLKTNNLDIIKILYNHNLSTKKAYKGFFFSSPIFQIIKQKKINYPLLEYMLNRGVDINKRDINNKYTPLAYAIKIKNNRLAKFLIEHNASINIGEEEKNPLILSIITKNREMFDYLIKNGAKSDIIFSSKLLFKDLSSISPNSIFAYKIKRVKKRRKIKTLKSINRKYPKIPIEDTFIKVTRDDDNKTRVYFILEDENKIEEKKIDINSSKILDINISDINETNVSIDNNNSKNLKKEIKRYLYRF